MMKWTAEVGTWMDSKKRRVMLIGLDGATFDLIKPWAKEGKLSNLNKLLSGGVSGKLTAPWLPITAPLWISMLCGKNPGKHGIYDFSRVEKGYETVPVTIADADSEMGYDLLSDAGKKVILINVPTTYPAQPVNGIMISGMPAPQLDENAVYPKEMLAELREQKYAILPEEVYEGENEEKIVAELDRLIDAHARVSVKLAKEKDWDFFFTVFFATDIVGHWFWKHMDATHPLHCERDAKFGGVIEHVYSKIDAAIGELIQCTDENTLIMVVSDHGMGPLYKDVFINNWLMEKGYLKLKRNVLTRTKKVLHDRGATLENAYKLAQKTGVAKVTAGTSASSERLRQFILKNFFISFADVDWNKTRAFSATNFGPIFINLKGREKNGIVEQKDYDSLCREIIDKLTSEFKDENGEPVIERAILKTEALSGPHLEDAPDILFWVKDMKYTTNRYFEFASNKLFGEPHRGMSGDHRMNGIFIAYGNCVHTNQKEQDVRIVDILPTVLNALGLEIPVDLDGRPLLGLTNIQGNASIVGAETDRIKYLAKKISFKLASRNRRGDELN